MVPNIGIKTVNATGPEIFPPLNMLMVVKSGGRMGREFLHPIGM